MLTGIKVKLMGLLAINKRTSRDHLAEEQRAGAVQPMQVAAVAICPRHHWRHGNEF